MGEVVKKEESGAPGERMLALIQSKYPGYHPLLAIAALAHSDKVKDDPKIALECHKTLVKYVASELKSVEVKGEIHTTRRVVVSLFDGESMPHHPGATIEHESPPKSLLAEKPDPLWELADLKEELAA